MRKTGSDSLGAACAAQRVVFLADGRVTGELADPTPAAVLGFLP